MGVTPEELKQAYDNTPVGQAYAVYGASDVTTPFYLWKTGFGRMGMGSDYEMASSLDYNSEPEYFVLDASGVSKLFNVNPIDPALMWE